MMTVMAEKPSLEGTGAIFGAAGKQGSAESGQASQTKAEAGP